MSAVGISVNVKIPEKTENVNVRVNVQKEESQPVKAVSLSTDQVQTAYKTGVIPSIKGGLAGALTGGVASALIFNASGQGKITEGVVYAASAVIGAVVANHTDSAIGGAILGGTIGAAAGLTVGAVAGFALGIREGITVAVAGAFAVGITAGMVVGISGAAAGFGGGIAVQKK